MKYTLIATIAAVGLIIGCWFIGQGLGKIKTGDNTISVTGSTQKTITSDVAKWTSTVSRSIAVDALKTGSDELAQDVSSLSKYLHQNGVSDGDITVQPLTISPTYSSDYSRGPNISGYTLSQLVIVEGKDVNKITQLAAGAGNLVSSGIQLSSQPLEYYYSGLADVKRDMLAEATTDAKARAEKIATSSGSKLGALKSASMGVFQITPVNSASLSDEGYYDTSSIEKRVTAVVRTQFAIR